MKLPYCNASFGRIKHGIAVTIVKTSDSCENPACIHTVQHNRFFRQKNL